MEASRDEMFFPLQGRCGALGYCPKTPSQKVLDGISGGSSAMVTVYFTSISIVTGKRRDCYSKALSGLVNGASPKNKKGHYTLKCIWLPL